MDKNLVFAVVDDLTSKMTKPELEQYESLMLAFKDFKTKKLSYDKLDEKLLFTGKKVKDAAYLTDDVMFGEYHGIKKLFESTIGKTMWQLVVEQTKQHVYIRKMQAKIEQKLTA